MDATSSTTSPVWRVRCVPVAPSACCSSTRRTTCWCVDSSPCADRIRCRRTLLDGIRTERERLAPIREGADLVIDTSMLNIHQLATHVSDIFSAEGEARHRVTLLSFGFKYGLPTDVDIVADMRFLPNPFWNEELRGQTGQDEPVREYVLSREGAMEFLDSYSKALVPVLEGYQRENKSHSTIAIGCTGGKHRSVAMSEELARRLAAIPGVAVNVRHRDLGRE